jgi:hypothetical protein
VENDAMLLPALLLASVVASHVGQPVALVGPPAPFRRIQSPRDCQLTIPKLSRLCRDDWFTHASQLEVALADLDHDGREDVAVRFSSLIDCGSHGCRTELYQALQTGKFARTLDDLVTDGPIFRCRQGATKGVAFPIRGAGFACFPFPRTATARR